MSDKYVEIVREGRERLSGFGFNDIFGDYEEDQFFVSGIIGRLGRGGFIKGSRGEVSNNKDYELNLRERGTLNEIRHFGPMQDLEARFGSPENLYIPPDDTLALLLYEHDGKIYTFNFIQPKGGKND